MTIGPDVAVVLVVGFDGAEDRLDHLLLCNGDFQLDGPGGLVEPLDVFLEPEHLAAVDADTLEDAVAVKQAVVVDTDLGVGLVEEFAVDVDFGCHERDSSFRAWALDTMPRSARIRSTSARTASITSRLVLTQRYSTVKAQRLMPSVASARQR